jgi:hypothetical protein
LELSNSATSTASDLVPLASFFALGLVDLDFTILGAADFTFVAAFFAFALGSAAIAVFFFLSILVYLLKVWSGKVYALRRGWAEPITAEVHRLDAAWHP